MIYAHPQYEFGVIALEVALDGMGKMIAQIEGREGISNTQKHRLQIFQKLVHRYSQVLPHFKDWVAVSNMYDNYPLTFDERAFDHIFDILNDDFDSSVEGSTTNMMVEFADVIHEIDQKDTPTRLQVLAIMLPAYSIFHHIHHEFTHKRRRLSSPDQKGEVQAPAVESF